MLNYLAKHQVVEFQMPELHECKLEDIKVLGVFEITYEGEYSLPVATLELDARAIEVLYFESYTGGGASFPPMSNVSEATLQDYTNDITKYMQNMKEKHLILLDTKGRYTIAILEVVAKIAKSTGKDVSVIAIEPFEFVGKHIIKMFHKEWEKLEQICDKQTLYSGMKMLKQLDESIKLSDTDKELVKIIFHDLYKSICLKAQNMIRLRE